MDKIKYEENMKERYNFIKAFRESVPKKNQKTYDKYVQACKDKKSDLYDMGYLYQAVQLLSALLNKTSVEKIKLGESLHDVATANIIAKIGGKAAINKLISLGAIPENVAKPALDKLSKEKCSTAQR